MRRKILDRLLAWKDSAYRKPLILQGARQVGKTWSILEFGRQHYSNVAYLNFETDPRLTGAFADSLDPDWLLPLLARLSGQTIVPGRTLLVFDEVQLCERALTSLKYFQEQSPEIHIIAAGSLLGVAVNRGRYSFPVGKVDMQTMLPMDFEEFLFACDEASLADSIRACHAENRSMPSVFHDAAMQLLRRYLLVGGMPECVRLHVETGDALLVRNAQNALLMGYLDDMSKYNVANEIKKTRLVYDNITVQLSKKNTRFQYKLVKTGGRASEFENAIEWLVLSGIIHRVHRVETPVKPLENYRDIDAFKTYVSDVGLLCAKKNIVPADLLIPNGELDDFKGGMMENYVCCQLIANGYDCFYWANSRDGEVDFLIQREGTIIPIEVKAAGNVKAKSLRQFCSIYSPSLAIKIAGTNFGFESGLKTIPLYAAFCI